MIEVSTIWSILKDLLSLGRAVSNKYKKIPNRYLHGELTTGLEISYRIIALFEAHGIKRTQIYNVLKEKFPAIGPSIDATKLDSIISGDLLDFISESFGIRKVWLEGEDGPIYEPLLHYKNFEEFSCFVTDLVSNDSERVCFLTALKSISFSDDLYKSRPEVALYFSKPIFEIGDNIIYRYYPIYGTFPWGHGPAKLHVSAFFNFVDRARGILPIGESVADDIFKIAEGEMIPGPQVKIKNIWHPEDYGYPLGSTIGKLKPDDWTEVLEYFNIKDGSVKINSDFQLPPF